MKYPTPRAECAPDFRAFQDFEGPHTKLAGLPVKNRQQCRLRRITAINSVLLGYFFTPGSGHRNEFIPNFSRFSSTFPRCWLSTCCRVVEIGYSVVRRQLVASLSDLAVRRSLHQRFRKLRLGLLLVMGCDTSPDLPTYQRHRSAD